MYSREIDGQEYTFGVSGKLVMNVLVMFDRQTGSLWSQLLGEAIEGPLTGTRLEYVPALHTTWSEWKTRHPDTLALVKGYAGDFDPYDRYYGSPSAGVIGEARSDLRLYVKEFVVGVEQGGEAVAYPFSALNVQPAVNDTIGGVPVLVVFEVEGGASMVYDRRVDGRVLTFSIREKEGMVLSDAETGSTWEGLSGLATDGPLAGERLTPLKQTRIFWFGWKDFYPDTRVYGQ